MSDKRARVRIGMGVMLAVIVSLLFSACGSGGGEPPTPTYNPFVIPLPADRPEMEVETDDGTLPCGIAQVDWGFRVFVMNDYPACKEFFPDLTVYCLDAEAHWTDQAIENVRVSRRDNNVTFDSRQEGICGLFPTEE